MADNDNDPAGSTQMFRAFVDEGTTSNPGTRAAATSSSSRTGLVVTVALVAVALVAAVVWLAVK